MCVLVNIYNKHSTTRLAMIVLSDHSFETRKIMSPSFWKKTTTLSGYFLAPVLYVLSIGFYDKAQAIDFAPLRNDICSKFTGDVFCVFDKSVIDISKDWKYSGGLPLEANNYPWKYSVFTTKFEGSRAYEITDNSYQLYFKGELTGGLESGTLIDFNKSRVKGGESIPTFWTTTLGYQVPAKSKVFKFSRDYSVKKDVLNPGELGCPDRPDVKRCRYKNTYLAGGATSIGGTIEAIGDISISSLSREAITINAAFSRNLNLLIDNNLVFSIGKSIGNTKTTLDQDDTNSGLTPTNLDLKGEVALGVGPLKKVDFKGSAGADAKFE